MENVFHIGNRDEDPTPGREMHAEEKVSLECGGCIAFQYIPKELAWSELQSGPTQEKVPLA